MDSALIIGTGRVIRPRICILGVLQVVIERSKTNVGSMLRRCCIIWSRIAREICMEYESMNTEGMELKASSG